MTSIFQPVTLTVLSVYFFFIKKSFYFCVATRRAAVAVCRGVSRVGRGCRGPSFLCQNRDMYLDTHRRGG